MLNSGTTEYKTYLESATTRELIKLADQAGINIPPDLDRIFIIRELLDNALDEETFITPLPGKHNTLTNQYPLALAPYKWQEGLIFNVSDTHFAQKTAALPEQYHITYLEVLPRDPQWVYIFWEIKAQERERLEADPRFEGFALKALENKKYGDGLPENCKDSDFAESFSVPVGKEDHSWYLGFTSPGMFRVALHACGLDTTIIVSRPFVLPKFLNSPGNKKILSSPLIELSGVSEFSVLRFTDRVSHCVHE